MLTFLIFHKDGTTIRWDLNDPPEIWEMRDTLRQAVEAGELSWDQIDTYEWNPYEPHAEQFEAAAEANAQIQGAIDGELVSPFQWPERANCQ